MKITLMGTGGAEGIPALFASSRVSDFARAYGGKDVRTRASALIDDELKIDLGPDLLSQVARCGVDARDWTGIVFTHTHDDHLAENEIQYALYPFVEATCAPFTIYGNQEVCHRFEIRYPDWPIELIQTKSFETFHHAGYAITPVRANHKLEEDSQNLLIQKDERTFFYATDTGLFLDETWEFLSDWRIDGLVIEATDGFKRTSYYGHMDLNECLSTVLRLRESGILREGAPVYTTHHGHWGDALHDEVNAFMNPHDVQAGYDGLVFEV